MNILALSLLLLPGQSLRSYDVSGVLRAAAEPSNPALWGTHLQTLPAEEQEGEEDGGNSYWIERSSSALLNAEDLLRLIRNYVTPATWSQGNARLDLQDNTLLVDAPAATHLEIEQFLKNISGLLQQQEIFVQVALLQTNARERFPQGPRLDSASTSRLWDSIRKDIETIWKSEGRTFSGYAFTAQRRERRTFLRGYDVEVATKAKAVQPVLGMASTGPAVAIRPTRLDAGDRIHLSYFLDGAELVSLQRFETRASDIGDVQVPLLRIASLVGSITLGLGESLLLPLPGEPARAVWIRLDAAKRASSETASLSLFDPRLLFDPTGKSLAALDPILRTEAKDPLLPWEGEVISGDFLAQMLPAPSDSRERGSLQRVAGGFFLHKPTGSELEPFRASYREIEKRYAEGAIVELSMSANPEGSGTAIFQTRLAATPGRFLGLLSGLESSYVSGYRVQIAQEAAIAGPVLEPLFEGLRFRAKLLQADEVHVTLALDLRTDLVTEKETLASQTQHAGNFFAVSKRSTQCLREISLPWNTPISLGEVGPIPGIPSSSRVFAFLTARKP